MNFASLEGCSAENSDASETALELYVRAPAVSTFEYLLSVCGFLRFPPAGCAWVGKALAVMCERWVVGPVPKLLPGVIRFECWSLSIPPEPAAEGVC